MNRAHQAVQADEFHEALQLLDRHRPEFVVPASAGSASDRSLAHPDRLKAGLQTDLRGWEWRYLWRQCQGEERFILGKHINGATAVGMLADGKTVFSAGGDKLVRLWNLESRRQIGMLSHSEEIIGAAASHDGRLLATATSKYAEGQPVLLWDLATQKIAQRIPGNNDSQFWTGLWLQRRRVRLPSHGASGAVGDRGSFARPGEVAASLDQHVRGCSQVQ